MGEKIKGPIDWLDGHWSMMDSTEWARQYAAGNPPSSRTVLEMEQRLWERRVKADFEKWDSFAMDLACEAANAAVEKKRNQREKIKILQAERSKRSFWNV